MNRNVELLLFHELFIIDCEIIVQTP